MNILLSIFFVLSSLTICTYTAEILQDESSILKTSSNTNKRVMDVEEEREEEDEERNEDMCAKFGAIHDMCLPPVGNKCGTDSINGGEKFDESTIQKMVDLHNQKRAHFASGGDGFPKAANMRKMTWDADLAIVAQRWADQCDFKHDENANREVPEYKFVGQNIYVGLKSKKKDKVPSKKAIKNWYKEIKDFTNDQISPYKFTHDTGHFSQLVWAETHKVGCGYSIYKQGKWWKTFVVCNYGPGGNTDGASMYVEGEPCSQCPSGTTCENGLCA